MWPQDVLTSLAGGCLWPQDAKGPIGFFRFASNWLRKAKPNLYSVRIVGAEGPEESLSFASDWLHKAKPNLYSVPIVGAKTWEYPSVLPLASSKAKPNLYSVPIVG